MSISLLEEAIALFHEDFKESYKQNSLGFVVKGYLSESFAGLILIINENRDFDTNIISVSDDEICNIFKTHSGRELNNTDELKDYIEFHDVRGFTENSFYFLKGVETFKWNKYTILKDLNDINSAIFKAARM